LREDPLPRSRHFFSLRCVVICWS